ncbi:Permease of the drug/metabolite transporter (DMT) superfamily [Granulicatella balaenopterae]|uniref:Permease of the drug/metabolite transporter (DMT) superfamily n=1 Tax=Granulicatella balaenopterae TaxID=137733 RepID=A0A1H9PR86_9LACT|nr:DMT family transporter [Granulicatella balaenopterae]SER50707.1 Permease of the drug/metabolite transporter (DMT) superfamily [Granulicatella balaenopterae]
MKNKTEKFLTKNWVVVIGATIACLLWGSAFPCIKIGYRLFEIKSNDIASQMLFAGIRFTLAGILTIILGSLATKEILIPKVKSAKNIFNLALMQTVGQYIFFYIGLANIAGVKGSILGSTRTFFALLIAALLFHQEKLTSKKLIACILGFAGVILVNMTGNVEVGSFSFMGDGFMLLANISAAFASVYIKKYSEQENPVILSGYQFIVGGIILAIIGKVFGGQLDNFTVASVSLLIYMAFISAVAYSIWALLLKVNPVSKVVVYGFLMPIFGVFLSAIILNELYLLGPSSLVALVLVCLGIYLISTAKEN